MLKHNTQHGINPYCFTPITDILNLLATHGWGRSEELDFATVPINNLANRFKTSLEKSGIDVSALEDEWIDLLDYSQKYLNTATLTTMTS